MIPFITGAITMAVVARRLGDPAFVSVTGAVILLLAGLIHAVVWYGVLSWAKTVRRPWVFAFSLLSLPLSAAVTVVGMWVALVMLSEWVVTVPMGVGTWWLLRMCERVMARSAGDEAGRGSSH